MISSELKLDLLNADSEEQEAKRRIKESKKSRKRKLSELSDLLPAETSHPSDKESNNENSTSFIEYPYDVVDDDHCETPVQAYQDIVSFLKLCASRLHKSNDQLAIYDPFYCEGNVKVRLASLGFTNVYNEKEDFYVVQKAGTCPPFDVLLTNPPYSGTHMERLLDFCAHAQKPCCLLVPNYVYMKDYFQRHKQLFFFITPAGNRRYLYTTPKGRRQQKSAKITSPFPTFWFCNLRPLIHGTLTPPLLQQLQGSNIVIAKHNGEIPLIHAPDSDPRKKKLRNNQKRKKNKDRKKQLQS